MTAQILTVDAAAVSKGFAGSLAVLKRVDDALTQVRALIQRSAVETAPKAEGTLIRNIKQEKLADLIHEIRSDAPHGGFVERGTGLQGPLKRASGLFMLPDSGVAAIAAWIARKGITPRSPNVSAKELPWIIARKIARSGTRPQPYMLPALDKYRSTTAERVNAAIKLGLRDGGLTVEGA